MRRKNKRERYLKHKNHLKRLADAECVRHPASVVYVDEIYEKGEWVENPKPYYKRRYRCYGGGSSRRHKRLSNRKIRRYRHGLTNGNSCHKLYDFWWKMS